MASLKQYLCGMTTKFGNTYIKAKATIRARIAFYAYRLARKYIGYGLASEPLIHHITLLFFVRGQKVHIQALSLFIRKLTPIEPKSIGTWRNQYASMCRQLCFSIGIDNARRLYSDLVDATLLATRDNLDLPDKYADMVTAMRTLKF